MLPVMFAALASLAIENLYTHPKDDNHGGYTHSSVWFDLRITSDIHKTSKVGLRPFKIHFHRIDFVLEISNLGVEFGVRILNFLV